MQPVIDQLLALPLAEAQAEIQAAIDRMGNPARIATAQGHVARGDAETVASAAARQYVRAFNHAKGA